MSDVQPEGAEGTTGAEEISEPTGNSEGLAAEAAAGAAPAQEPAPAKEAAPAKEPASAKGAAASSPTAAATADEDRPNRRKVREGLVVSVKMEQTAVVGVIERVRHPRYAKTVQRTKRLYAHNTDTELKPGDRVRLQETRPLSKLKRWRIIEVLERAK